MKEKEEVPDVLLVVVDTTTAMKVVAIRIEEDK